MPRGDRTGPGGMGPMTGRAAGFCAGYHVPGFLNPAGNRPYGLGFGHGYGGGMGMAWGRARRWDMPPMTGAPYSWAQDPTAPDEKQFLENQLNSLKKQMNVIEKRLGEFNKQKED